MHVCVFKGIAMKDQLGNQPKVPAGWYYQATNIWDYCHVLINTKGKTSINKSDSLCANIAY